MKFSFNKNALVNEISIAQELISTKNTATVSSYVSLTAENNSLVIKAVDSKMNFQAKIPVDITKEGTAVVFCAKLMSSLSLMPDGDIEFETQEKDGLLSAVVKHSIKHINFKLWCYTNEKFPEIENFNNAHFFDIPSKDFKKMISQTIFAVSTDPAKYFIGGVYFEKENDNFILVASDGNRLAYSSRPFLAEVEEMNSIIVHPKILNIVAKHASDEGSVSMATLDKNVIFKFSNYILSASLIDGKFPAYKRVIPENSPFSFKVSKSEFLSAVKRISVMSDQVKIFFNIKQGVLDIYSSSSFGEAKEEIPCNYVGENITVAMKTKNIEDAVKSIDSDYVMLEFKNESSSFVIRPEPTESYFSIIMPMRAV